jgi:hypothetical protein
LAGGVAGESAVWAIADGAPAAIIPTTIKLRIKWSAIEPATLYLDREIFPQESYLPSLV